MEANAAAAASIAAALPGVDAAVATLIEKNGPQAVQTAATTLSGVLSRIHANPTVPKYRKLNKMNEKVAEKVLGPQGSTALLCSVGFKTQGTLLLMADDAIDDAKLSYTLACLETLVESKTAFDGAKAAAEREARQAQLKAEQSALKRQRQNLIAAKAGDDAARKDPNWKAKIFEKNGPDMARPQNLD